MVSQFDTPEFIQFGAYNFKNPLFFRIGFVSKPLQSRAIGKWLIRFMDLDSTIFQALPWSLTELSPTFSSAIQHRKKNCSMRRGLFPSPENLEIS